MKIVLWLNEPAENRPIRRWEVIALALIYVAMTTMLFILGEAIKEVAQ